MPKRPHLKPDGGVGFARVGGERSAKLQICPRKKALDKRVSSPPPVQSRTDYLRSRRSSHLLIPCCCSLGKVASLGSHGQQPAGRAGGSKLVTQLKQRMAPWSVNILLHRGGAFSKEGSLTYDGGNVAVFRNIDKDVMSYFHLVDLAKSVGCKDGDTLFYGIPGRSLDNGIDHIKDDNSVSEMMKYANQTNYLEVYVQHNELHTGGHPTVGDTEQRNPPAQVKKGKKTRKMQKKRERGPGVQKKKMTESGWKADTGHKSGYMTYIEKELAKKFPNANIKADPHVMSQSNGSGFGWDDERKMVAGDKELFDGWAKSQNGAANLYMKPFVHYDKLCKIYANDLAKESNAKGPGDEFDFGEEQSVDNTMTEQTQQSESVVESQSHLQCPGSNPSSGNKNSGSRKRKHVDDEAVSFELFNLSKSLTHLVEAETINATAMQVIQSAYDHKLKAQKLTDERREQLYSVVTKFSEFTCDQLVRADRIIGADATTLNMFFTTPKEYKSEYIRQVLESSK
ncbi:hypothetical protein EJB05_56299, partial [Eragrostis curvula]